MAKFKSFKLEITHPSANAEIKGSSLNINVKAMVHVDLVPGEPDIFAADNVTISVTGASSVTRKKTSLRKPLGYKETFNITTSGIKTIKVTAKYGNKSKTISRKVSVTIDTTPPQLIFLKPQDGENIAGSSKLFSTEISARASDPAGVKAVQYRVDNRGRFQNLSKDRMTSIWNKMIDGLTLGRHTIQLRATDGLGNTSKIITKTITCIDTGAPEISITSPEAPSHKVTWQDGGVDIEISGTASDLATGIQSVQWSLDSGTLNTATNVSGDWSNWRFTANISAPGTHNIKVRATDGTGNNTSTDVVEIDVAVPFKLEDIGFAAYLEDLMIFTARRVRQVNEATPVEKTLLSNTFHQPYERLTEIDYTVVTTKPVAQVRIAIEVLRRYLSNNQQFPEYLETAYRLLLSNLGTSYAEIRLMRTADSSTREALAKRLGIAESGLNQLYIPPELMTEAKLQTVFGYMDTTQDPLILAVDQAELF